MNHSNKANKIVLEHEQARVTVTESTAQRREICVEMQDSQVFTPLTRCETSYPVDLIKQILEVKGPAYLCDEIARDESTEYVQRNVKLSVLTYVSEADFKHKRVLDFGCGSGASTAVLARMFPDAEILGIELEQDFVSIARARAEFYGLENATFEVSQNPDRLPDGMGEFDFIMLSAVYEHLLPRERNNLLPQLWTTLKKGGILFVYETPYRYFPIEGHTTNGLPLINYLPDKWALYFARKYSVRNLDQDDWETLLRKGIRGGSVSEIMGILKETGAEPTMLSPSRNGARDRIDIWWQSTPKGRYGPVKRAFRLLVKALKTVSGIELLPILQLAIRKDRDPL